MFVAAKACQRTTSTILIFCIVVMVDIFGCGLIRWRTENGARCLILLVLADLLDILARKLDDRVMSLKIFFLSVERAAIY